MKSKDVPTVERIRATLEEEIFRGIIPPGHRLDEQKEADRFGVSRTPLREAIRALASVGLLTVLPRRGTTVAALDVSQIIEMLEVLAPLEELVARLAAQNITDREMKAIAQLNDRSAKLVSKGRIDDYHLLGKEIRDTLHESTGNRFLAETARNLCNRVYPYLKHQLKSSGRAKACLAEQQAIIKAVTARDADKAAACMKAHVKMQQRVFSEFMAALERTGLSKAIRLDAVHL